MMQSKLDAHRKAAYVTCPDDCLCWDLEAALAEIAKKDEEIAALKVRIKELERESEIDHNVIHLQRDRIKELKRALEDIIEIHLFTHEDVKEMRTIAKQALKEKP